MASRLGALTLVFGVALPGCGHFPLQQTDRPLWPWQTRIAAKPEAKPAPYVEVTDDQPPPRPQPNSNVASSLPNSDPDTAHRPLDKPTPVTPESSHVAPAGYTESQSLTGLPFRPMDNETAPKPEPLIEALRCVLDNRHSEALKHLQKYDQSTQELFLRLLPVMSILSQKGLDQLTTPEVAVLNEQLYGLLVTLRPRTELAIPKMCFCDWVKAYGIYKPRLEGGGFLVPSGNRPGELVQLYVELRNFTNELQNGWYTTRLSSTVEIHEAREPAGKPIWFYRFDDHKHPLKSRTLVHDYFNNYTFYVPNIPPGSYLLTITVADETHPERRRVARKSLEFRVTSVPPPTGN